LSALAAKTGAGGKKQPVLPMPRGCPLGGATLRKSKSSAAATPTATSTLTGPHVMGQTMHEDDVKVGVPSTTTMMTMSATMTTVGALPRCLTRSGTSSRPPSKGTRQNLVSWGSRRPPFWDRNWLGVGGVGTPTTGLEDHRNPDGEKVKRA
jgi:hypothetical protein